MKGRGPRTALVALVLCCSAPARLGAQDPAAAPASGPASERYSAMIGVYSIHARTEVRLDARSGRRGSRVRFEDELGLDGQTVVFGPSLTARIGRRHRLELEHFGLDRRGSRRISRTIRFGGDSYEAGFELDTLLDVDITRLGYAYPFAQGDRSEIAVNAGLHVADISIDARVAVQPITAARQEHAETTAPLPVVGLEGTYRFAPKWTFQGHAHVFRLSTEDFEGALNYASVSVEHATFRRVGIGLAADFFEIDVDSEATNLRGAVKLQASGPRLFVRAHF